MKTTIFITLVIAAFVAVFAACNNATSGTVAPASPDSVTLVKKGMYLVNAMGCDDCHSPKKMGAHGPEVIAELRFSGFQHNNQLPPVDTAEIKKGFTLFNPDFTAFIGMWGISYAANISSDGTGIGNWSEQQFFNAIRHGKYKGLDGSRDLLPPMPWTVYKNLNDEDIRSIFYFLKTTTPVKNIVPGPKQFDEIQSSQSH